MMRDRAADLMVECDELRVAHALTLARAEKAEATVARVEALRRKLEAEAVHGFSDQRHYAREFLRELRPALEGGDDE